jgi:DNA-binding NarL/FixJ family response regulator
MKIMIVDDHVLFREGTAAILRSEPDITIVGLAGTVQEALDTARQVRPEIILMDFNLPDGTGAEATRLILSEQPGCKIIYLTVYEDDENLFEGIRSGAKGYLLKNIRPAKLVAALRSVYQGESALSRSMTLRLMEELALSREGGQAGNARQAKLTPREQEVLRAIAAGRSNREIAAQLYLSENTVKYHVHSILEKLALPDRKAAVDYARQNGLLK